MARAAWTRGVLGCVLMLGMSGCQQRPVGSGYSPAMMEEPPEWAPEDAEEPEPIKAVAAPQLPARNPFLTPEEQRAQEAQPPRPEVVRKRLDSPQVGAIFYAPPASKAIVAGKIVREGDVIDRMQVAQIQPEAVILKDLDKEGTEYLLELRRLVK